jgi:hypothetical protein
MGSAKYVKIQPVPGVTVTGPIDKGIPQSLAGVSGPTVGAISGPPPLGALIKNPFDLAAGRLAVPQRID